MLLKTSAFLSGTGGSDMIGADLSSLGNDAHKRIQQLEGKCKQDTQRQRGSAGQTNLNGGDH